MRPRKRKRVLAALPAKLNKYITSHNQSLSAWASVATLISIPLVLVGIYIGYIQIRDLLIRPSIELEFVQPSSVAYTIKNTSDKTVENVLGIFKVDGAAVPNFEYFNLKGYLCRHPESKDLAVQIEFSNHSKIRGFSENLLSLGNEFFEKTVFSVLGQFDVR